MENFLLLEFINVINTTLCSIFMAIILIYLIENPNLRTKKNTAFMLTFMSLSIFFLGNYFYYSFESHGMFEYPNVEGLFDFIISTSVFAILICYSFYLFIESGEKKFSYLLSFLVTVFIIVGIIGVGLILITTGSEESFFYYLLAFGGSIIGSIFGIITLFSSIQELLFPVQDRMLMRRSHLKYVGGGIICISLGSFAQLLVNIIPEIVMIVIPLVCISVLFFYISIAKTRGHLREISVRVIEDQLDDLKNVDELRSQIIDVSSHEIRTPITVIRGHFDLLLMDEINKQMNTETRKKSYEAIKRNFERIERSISNIYDFSKIRRDLFDYQFEEASIANVLDNTINDMKNLIHRKGLTIMFIDEHKKNQKIRMDPVRISQVIRNLLENAIKYSAKGEITVMLNETENEVIISVEDQGIGIEEERKQRIFNPFKDQNKSTISVKGLGLGLYISKNILEGHNGKIWVESEKSGSKFSFSLPKLTIPE